MLADQNHSGTGWRAAHHRVWGGREGGRGGRDEGRGGREGGEGGIKGEEGGMEGREGEEGKIMKGRGGGKKDPMKPYLWALIFVKLRGGGWDLVQNG